MCVCVCYKQLYYFQGVQGPSGPPGAKGIAGEPVSSLCASMNELDFGSIIENKPHYQSTTGWLFSAPSGLDM